MMHSTSYRAFAILILTFLSISVASGAITLPNTGSDVDATLEPSVKSAVAGTTLQKAMAKVYNSKGKYIASKAAEMGVSAEALAAVLYVESTGSGFGTDGRMVARFENHIFNTRYATTTAKATTFASHYTYDSQKPWTGHTWRNSTSDPFTSFHGDQNKEWRVLQFSQQLDDTAALLSASFGCAQIMGFNYASIGYASVQAMFTTFSSSIKAQLDGLCTFILGRAACINNLKAKNYVEFAGCYNGAGQKEAYGANIASAAAAYAEVLLSLGIPVEPTLCNTGSATGTCIDTTSQACPGTLFSGFCPGSSSIRCCVKSSITTTSSVSSSTSTSRSTTSTTTATPTGPACSYNSIPGQCIDANTNTCSGTLYTGLCSGASNIRCCVRDSCTYNSFNGKCINTDIEKCGGSIYSGLCPGGNSIRCCVADVCSYNFQTGKCIDVTTQGCSGQLLYGLCPGAANIKCCLP